MKSFYLTLAVISVLLHAALAGYSVDVKQLVTGFTCMKQAGADTAIIRAYMSFGAVDPNAVTNLNNAISSSLKTEVYMFPCYGKDPKT